MNFENMVLRKANFKMARVMSASIYVRCPEEANPIKTEKVDWWLVGMRGRVELGVTAGGVGFSG